MKKFNVIKKQMLVKKKGAKGAELHNKGKRHSIRAPTVKIVVDPTGAGDVLAGVFLALMSHGKPPKEALEQPAKTAGMKCIAVPNYFTKKQDFSKADLIVESLEKVNSATFRL